MIVFLQKQISFCVSGWIYRGVCVRARMCMHTEVPMCMYIYTCGSLKVLLKH